MTMPIVGALLLALVVVGLFFTAAGRAEFDAAGESLDGVLANVQRQVRQAICGLHGHDSLLAFGTQRLSLRCTSCGHDSPGWDLRGAATTPVRPARAPRPA